MTSIQQLTLPDAAPWLPPEPTDPEAIALLRAFKVAGTLYRPTPGTSEDRKFRRTVEDLRRLGWPICASSSGKGYRLSFDLGDLDALEKDLRARALSTLRTLNRVKRIRQRRAA